MAKRSQNYPHPFLSLKHLIECHFKSHCYQRLPSQKHSLGKSLVWWKLRWLLCTLNASAPLLPYSRASREIDAVQAMHLWQKLFLNVFLWLFFAHRLHTWLIRSSSWLWQASGNVYTSRDFLLGGIVLWTKRLSNTQAKREIVTFVITEVMCVFGKMWNMRLYAFKEISAARYYVFESCVRMMNMLMRV